MAADGPPPGAVPAASTQQPSSDDDDELRDDDAAAAGAGTSAAYELCSHYNITRDDDDNRTIGNSGASSCRLSLKKPSFTKFLWKPQKYCCSFSFALNVFAGKKLFAFCYAAVFLL